MKLSTIRVRPCISQAELSMSIHQERRLFSWTVFTFAQLFRVLVRAFCATSISAISAISDAARASVDADRLTRCPASGQGMNHIRSRGAAQSSSTIAVRYTIVPIAKRRNEM